MRKIVTITFSPCIDKGTSVPALVAEKKLKCSAPKLEPGGGGINVARAIKKLGGRSLVWLSESSSLEFLQFYRKLLFIKLAVLRVGMGGWFQLIAWLLFFFSFQLLRY